MAHWKDAFMHSSMDANKVYDELQAIPDSERTPERIVEEAQNTDKELHKGFTWDDTEAAQKCRLFEARQIVNHLIVKFEAKDDGEDDVTLYVPAFASVFMEDEEVKGRRYVSTTPTIISRDDLRRKVLNDIESLLNQIDSKLSNYRVLFNGRTFNLIAELREEIRQT